MGSKRPARKSSVKLLGRLFVLGLIVSASSSFAQSLDDLARQERERRANQPDPARVYTNEDLARPRILNPEDRQANKESQPVEQAPTVVAVPPFLVAPVPVAESEPKPEPETPSSLIAAPMAWPAHISLGEIARYYRAAKQFRKEEIVAAKARRQKSGPSSIAAASRLPSAAPKTPLGPPPSPKFAPLPGPALARAPEAVRTVPPRSNDSVRVGRGDSLWKLALRHLGDGNAWRKIAAVNPQLKDPNRVQVGEEVRLPARESAPVARQVRVQQGDSLWKLAASQFGNGQAWNCIAAANPQILDSNRIYPGQLLVIPTGCSTGA